MPLYVDYINHRNERSWRRVVTMSQPFKTNYPPIEAMVQASVDGAGIETIRAVPMDTSPAICVRVMLADRDSPRILKLASIHGFAEGDEPPVSTAPRSSVTAVADGDGEILARLGGVMRLALVACAGQVVIYTSDLDRMLQIFTAFGQARDQAEAKMAGRVAELERELADRIDQIDRIETDRTTALRVAGVADGDGEILARLKGFIRNAKTRPALDQIAVHVSDLDRTLQIVAALAEVRDLRGLRVAELNRLFCEADERIKAFERAMADKDKLIEAGAQRIDDLDAQLEDKDRLIVEAGQARVAVEKDRDELLRSGRGAIEALEIKLGEANERIKALETDRTTALDRLDAVRLGVDAVRVAAERGMVGRMQELIEAGALRIDDLEAAMLRARPVAEKMPLTFARLREANAARQRRWDAEGRLQGDIGLLWRSNELGGEVGELQNAIKKLVRENMGIRGSRTTTWALVDELADVVICADLLAMDLGIDLDLAVRAKFNQTSDKVGIAVRL